MKGDGAENVGVVQGTGASDFLLSREPMDYKG